MAPEFESAARDLRGRVRFVKLDTDEEPDMANRMNIQGLPTLLFLDSGVVDVDAVGDDDGVRTAEAGEEQVILKQKTEGALRKEEIVALCEYLFFNGTLPDILKQD